MEHKIYLDSTERTEIIGKQTLFIHEVENRVLPLYRDVGEITEQFRINELQRFNSDGLNPIESGAIADQQRDTYFLVLLKVKINFISRYWPRCLTIGKSDFAS